MSCENCDSPIPEARLRAVPTATLCVRCQAQIDAPIRVPKAVLVAYAETDIVRSR